MHHYSISKPERLHQIMTSTDLSKIANREFEKLGVYLDGGSITISNGRRFMSIYLTAEERREFACQLIRSSYEK